MPPKPGVNGCAVSSAGRRGLVLLLDVVGDLDEGFQAFKGLGRLHANLFNIEALRITYTILGVPYYNYVIIMGPETLV